ADVAGGDVGDLRSGDLEALLQVLLARSHVEADQPRVRVLRGEGVHGVGETALLADLLEEARRRRAAEDRVEDRGGEAAAVGTGDADRPDTDVVLLGLLGLEAEAGRRLLDQRCADTR